MKIWPQPCRSWCASKIKFFFSFHTIGKKSLQSKHTSTLQQMTWESKFLELLWVFTAHSHSHTLHTNIVFSYWSVKLKKQLPSSLACGVFKSAWRWKRCVCVFMCVLFSAYRVSISQSSAASHSFPNPFTPITPSLFVLLCVNLSLCHRLPLEKEKSAESRRGTILCMSVMPSGRLCTPRA